MSDDLNHVVYRIDLAAPSPSAEYFIGRPLHLSQGFNGDHQAATDAFLDIPGGVAVDSGGKVHVTEGGTQRVRRVGLADILPGEHPNVVRDRDRTIDTAISATYGFSPFSLDPSTLSVAGAPVALDDHGRPKVQYRDVDRDGRVDLVFKVRARDLGLQCSAREAAVVGGTWSGAAFQEADWITLPCARRRY